MGTWGKGNFEDDTAADFFSIYMSKLISEIEGIIDNSKEIEPDEYEGVALPCKIEILTVLTEKNWAGCVYPNVKLVESWSEKYLDIYDAYYQIDDEENIAFISERRKVIEKTFKDYILSIISIS